MATEAQRRQFPPGLVELYQGVLAEVTACAIAQEKVRLLTAWDKPPSDAFIRQLLGAKIGRKRQCDR